MRENSSASSWPTEPYKGLAYYGPQDSLLFAGRDEDIDACVSILAEPKTRLLILHGRTACGKSSFLRAGLIPELEKHGFGYQFLRASDAGQQGPPVFIRCGPDPISKIAEELFRYASKVQTVSTAIGTQELDLSGCLLGHDNIESFVRACYEERTMWTVFVLLSERLLHTLVLVVDQAEEVITLTQPSDPQRLRFFRFLQEFANTPLKLKLILALRKESFADLFSVIQLDNSLKTDIKQFGLSDLDFDEVLRAIELPTDKVGYAGRSPPYDIYGFEYSPGIAKRITGDLFRAAPSGGVLPVMQIVCRDLYNGVRVGPRPWIIDERQYFAGGRITGRVDNHITRSLEAAKAGNGQDGHRMWRQILSKLVQREVDGTVKTEVVSAGRLSTIIRDAGAVGEYQGILDYLCRPEILILRTFTTLTGELKEERFYSLGHDVIALTLSDWKLRDDEQIRRHRAERRARNAAWWVAAAVVVAAVSAATAIYQIQENAAQAAENQADALRRASESAMGTDVNLALIAAIEAAISAEEAKRWWRAPVANPLQTLREFVARMPNFAPIGGGDWEHILAQTGRFMSVGDQVSLFDIRTENLTVLDDLPFEVFAAIGSSNVDLNETDDGNMLFSRSNTLHPEESAITVLSKEGRYVGEITGSDITEIVTSTPIEFQPDSLGFIVSASIVFAYNFAASGDMKVFGLLIDAATATVSAGSGYRPEDGPKGHRRFSFNVFDRFFLVTPVDQSHVKGTDFASTITYDLGGANWNIVAPQSQRISDGFAAACESVNQNGTGCLYRLASNNFDGQVLIASVRGVASPLHQTPEPNIILQIVDVPSGDSTSVSASELATLARIRIPIEAFVGDYYTDIDGGEAPDAFFTGGVIDSLVMGYKQGNRVDLYKYSNGWTYWGYVVAQDLSRGKVALSADGSLLMGTSDFVYWDISEPFAAKVDRISSLTLSQLMILVCGSRWKPDVAVIEKGDWFEWTGLTSPPIDRCVSKPLQK